MEEEMEEVSAFAEDAAQDFGDGENELAVGNGVADAGGDPFAGLAGAALVAGGAEVPGFAGEGEELFVAAIQRPPNRSARSPRRPGPSLGPPPAVWQLSRVLRLPPFTAPMSRKIRWRYG